MRFPSKGGLSVRPLTSHDAAGALRLYDILTLGPKGARVADFERVIDHPGTTVLGLADDTSVLAMVTLHLLPNVTFGGRPYGLIENVVVDPDHRGRGMVAPSLRQPSSRQRGRVATS